LISGTSSERLGFGLVSASTWAAAAQIHLGFAAASVAVQQERTTGVVPVRQRLRLAQTVERRHLYRQMRVTAAVGFSGELQLARQLLRRACRAMDGGRAGHARIRQR
jgi:hypothetical protein